MTTKLPVYLSRKGSAEVPAAPPKETCDMTTAHVERSGHERIIFMIYPGFTALDMVGPPHMLSALMGAKVQIVAKTRDPVRADTGLTIVPDASFDDCDEAADIFCLPGGTLGTLAVMRDPASLGFVKHVGGTARLITSVCTGSLILGAAGLLDGYRATSHWVTKPLLPIFGAIPTEGCVVQDRNRITGGGVTAGIDFGLTLVGDLRGRSYAEGVQLLAEYAPAPPFNAGSPTSAPIETKTMLEGMFAGFVDQATTAAHQAVALHARL